MNRFEPSCNGSSSPSGWLDLWHPHQPRIARLMFLSGEDTSVQTFACTLNTKPEELNDNNFDTQLAKMDCLSPLFIESGARKLSASHQERLLKHIRENNVTLIFKNCEPSDMQDYVAIRVSGQFVVVKSTQNGRLQKVTVHMSEPEVVVSSEEVDVNKSGSDQPSSRMLKNVDEKDVAQQVIDDTCHSVEAIKATGHWTRSMSLADYCSGSSIVGGSSSPWFCETILEVIKHNVMGTLTVPGQPWIKESTVHAYCKINIRLYATNHPGCKYVWFHLTDGVGVDSTDMGNDTDLARGFFTNAVEVYIWPGKNTTPKRSCLPPQWMRHCYQPHTENPKTTYKSTTGWNICASAGYVGNQPCASVRATFEARDEITKEIPDFSVRSIANESSTGWKFYYTAMNKEGWKQHFTRLHNVKEIADLAKSTLNCNCECIYRAPVNCIDVVHWNARFTPQWACLWKRNGFERMRSLYSCSWTQSMDIDMKWVSSP